MAQLRKHISQRLEKQIYTRDCSEIFGGRRIVTKLEEYSTCNKNISINVLSRGWYPST